MVQLLKLMSYSKSVFGYDPTRLDVTTKKATTTVITREQVKVPMFDSRCLFEMVEGWDSMLVRMLVATTTMTVQMIVGRTGVHLLVLTS